MKNIMTAFLAIMMIGGINAQNNAIQTYFSDLSERDDMTKISITGKIFQMAAYLETDDEEIEEFKEFVSTIHSFQAIVGDEPEFSSSDYYASLSKVENSYEELMSVEDKNGSFNFRIKEKNGVVKELLMVGLSESDLIILSLTGEMDLRQLSKMTSKVQMEGFDYLSKMDENGMDEIKVYPNPASAGSPFNIEVPESFVGGTATLYDMNGRLVMTYPMGTRKQQVRIDKVKPGNYVIEFLKDNVKVTRKVEVQ